MNPASKSALRDRLPATAKPDDMELKDEELNQATGGVGAAPAPRIRFAAVEGESVHKDHKGE